MHTYTYAYVHFYTYISVVWEEPKTRRRCSQEKWRNLFPKHGARAGNEQDNPGRLSIKLYLTVMQIPLEEAELSQFLKHYMNQPRKGNSWWWQRSVKCIEWWPQYSQVNRGGVKQPFLLVVLLSILHTHDKIHVLTLFFRFRFSSVQFSHSVMSDSLRPHESQHARPPCPSPSPGVHSDSCP